MDGPKGQGLLSRLKRNETLNRITGGRPEIAIFGAPIVLVVLIAIGVTLGVVLGGGGDGGNESVVGKTPTAKASATPTPGENAGLKTPINISEGDILTLSDLQARGVGEPARGEFKGERLIIPAIGVDAPFSVKKVDGGGQMPNPNGPEDVAWYDFSSWPSLGGLPGKGGNVVVAGHVDYINYGPAVFWDLSKLQPGDLVTIRMQDGSEVSYEVEFNKHIDAAAAPWDEIVKATADESITLITCSGTFSAGHYNNRQIVWGRRV